MTCRVRFAPSPTGYLHIGNARTALFNYLFARKNKGKFILRVEDTDMQRSSGEYEAALMEDLKWFGIEWDEGPDIGGPSGPYRQMERLDIYRAFAERLEAAGSVYRCYCTREEIESRNKDTGRNQSSGYDNHCRSLSEDKKHMFLEDGRTAVLRFSVPPCAIKINDLIRGEVVFEPEYIPDFVIMKPDGMPVFHFAVVVDDYRMNITHVIRGEDHLSNTPKHIMLFEALGAPIPRFAHMSMTLGPDKTRLSKRHGATSVRAYRENGYLPEAFFNYISLLGWGTADSQDVFSADELISKFSIERCTGVNAVFSPEKLLWMNGVYIRKTDPGRLLKLAMPYLQETGMVNRPPDAAQREYLERAIALEQEKIKLVKDIPRHIDFFLAEPVYEAKAVEKHLDRQGKEVLAGIAPVLEACGQWTAQPIEEAVRHFCEEQGYKTARLFHPLRVAVSGRTRGPGLFEMLELLGREKTLARIRRVAGAIDDNKG